MPCQSLSWNSGTPTYRRSSPIAQRGFCPECGSPLSLATTRRQPRSRCTSVPSMIRLTWCLGTTTVQRSALVGCAAE
ncbi:hypothetical protein [Mesorhizobium sp. M0674]